MGIGTNGIATVSNLVYGKGLALIIGANMAQCPTKAVIQSMGGIVSGSYVNTQLVKYSDVSPPPAVYYILTINTVSSWNEVALFTPTGTPSPNTAYPLLLSSGSNQYKSQFQSGAGLTVNDPAYPNYSVQIIAGYQYSIWARQIPGAPWTKLGPNKTHYDSDYTETV